MNLVESNTLLERVNYLVQDCPVGHVAVAFALGATVGRLLPLPDENQLNSKEFNSLIEYQSNDFISKVNELMTIDTGLAVDVFRATYRVRVVAAFPQPIVLSPEGCICGDLFDIPNQFDKIPTDKLQEHKEVVVNLMKLFKQSVFKDV